VPIAKPRTITFFVDTKSPLKRMGNRIQINAHMVLVNEKIKKGCVTSPQCIYNINKKKNWHQCCFFFGGNWRSLNSYRKFYLKEKSSTKLTEQEVKQSIQKGRLRKQNSRHSVLWY